MQATGRGAHTLAGTTTVYTLHGVTDIIAHQLGLHVRLVDRKLGCLNVHQLACEFKYYELIVFPSFSHSIYVSSTSNRCVWLLCGKPTHPRPPTTVGAASAGAKCAGRRTGPHSSTGRPGIQAGTPATAGKPAAWTRAGRLRSIAEGGGIPRQPGFSAEHHHSSLQRSLRLRYVAHNSSFILCTFVRDVWNSFGPYSVFHCTTQLIAFILSVIHMQATSSASRW